MKAYTRLFDLALNGSYCSRSKMERDPSWRALLAAAETVSSRLDDTVRPFYSIGTVESGGLLNTMSERDALARARRMPERPDDPRVRAELAYLGQTIIKAAERRLPLMVRRLAKAWRHATAEQQIRLAEEACGVLAKLDGSKPATALQDFRGQPNSRVLPKEYKHRGQSPKPNCVGKAQLACAFAKLAGARFFTYSPIRRSDIDACFRYGTLQCDLLDLLVGCQPAPPAYFIESLAGAAAKNLKSGCATAMLHAAVIIELADGRWLLFDPNYSIHSVIEDQDQVKEIVDRLSRYREAAPGLSLQLLPREKKADRVVADFDLETCLNVVRRVVLTFDRLARERSLTNERALRVLSHPRTYPVIAPLLFLPEDKTRRPIESLRRYFDNAAFLIAAREDFGCKTTEAALKRLIRRLPATLCSRLDRIACQAGQYRRASATRVPAEIHNPEQFLAASVLVHLAYNAGCSASVEEVLAEHGGGQYRLLYRCLRWKTGMKKHDERAERVCAILRSLPARLISVDVLFGIMPDRTETLNGAKQWLTRRKKAAARSRVKRIRSRKAESRAPRTRSLPPRARRQSVRRRAPRSFKLAA